MRMRRTERSDKRPLAHEGRTAVRRRRRQEKRHAADGVLTTTEAHPDQLAALQKSHSGTFNSGSVWGFSETPEGKQSLMHC